VENLWVVLSLISAFSLATSDALTKKALRYDNEYIIGWLRLVFSLPPLFVLFLFFPIPELDRTFYQAFFFALPLEILAMALYIKALRVSPMSLTLPFLSLTPVFLIITAHLIVDESVTLRGGTGIVLVAAGGYILNFSSVRNSGPLAPLKVIMREKGSVYMIMVAFIFSITSSLGKLAIGHSSPLFFASTYFIAVTLCFTPLVYLNKNKGSLLRILRKDAGKAILPGLLFSAMIVSHILAISLTSVAYMVAIKRSSLIIGSIYGIIFFGEKNSGERLLGAALMFSGFLLIVTG
jgi:drug/metabolite transporter (DMT)-like permease